MVTQNQAEKKKTPQSTSESGFCNFNTDTVQINCSAHFGGNKNQKTKETNVHKKTS